MQKICFLLLNFRRSSASGVGRYLLRVVPKIFLMLLMLASAQGQTAWTRGAGTNDWQTAGNWNNGLPAGNFTGIQNGNTVQLNTGTATTDTLTIRLFSELNVSNGADLNTQLFSIGSSSTATVLVSGAGTTVTSSLISLGAVSGNGTLTIENSALVTTTTAATNTFVLGNNNGTGQLNLNSGGILATNSVTIGSAGSGAVDFDGGTLRGTTNNTEIFSGGFGTGDITLLAGGGTIDTNSFNLGTAQIIDGTGA
ncbi:MAG: hypothetical protein KTR33_15270, partial [Gammaproteobacteria bacterium]|nr:hypothetical protein [Gammaproteobacteria bacterium]